MTVVSWCVWILPPYLCLGVAFCVCGTDLGKRGICNGLVSFFVCVLSPWVVHVWAWDGLRCVGEGSAVGR